MRFRRRPGAGPSRATTAARAALRPVRVASGGHAPLPRMPAEYAYPAGPAWRDHGMA